MKINLLRIRLLFTLCVFCLYTEGATAQQEGNMTLFMYNPWAVNPAAAGYRVLPSFVLYHRSQWLGFKGAPTFQSVNVNMPAFRSRRLGVGFGLTNRRAGYFESQTGVFALSYSVIKTGNFAVRMGIQSSMRRLTTHFKDAADILALQADRSIPPRLSTNYFVNLGLGALVTYGESYLGFSVPYYLPNVIGINPYSPVSASEAAHYYLMGGLSFQVAEGLILKPQAMFKYTRNAPWNIETNFTFMVQEQASFGASYRAGRTNLIGVGESLSLTTFFQVNERMALGGAYDWILSPIGQFSYGSFEMLMRYDLKKTEVKFSNPRGF